MIKILQLRIAGRLVVYDLQNPVLNWILQLFDCVCFSKESIAHHSDLPIAESCFELDFAIELLMLLI